MKRKDSKLYDYHYFFFQIKKIDIPDFMREYNSKIFRFTLSRRRRRRRRIWFWKIFSTYNR